MEFRKSLYPLEYICAVGEDFLAHPHPHFLRQQILERRQAGLYQRKLQDLTSENHCNPGLNECKLELPLDFLHSRIF